LVNNCLEKYSVNYVYAKINNQGFVDFILEIFELSGISDVVNWCQ
jgi:hypothetical protein